MRQRIKGPRACALLTVAKSINPIHHRRHRGPHRGPHRGRFVNSITSTTATNPPAGPTCRARDRTGAVRSATAGRRASSTAACVSCIWLPAVASSLRRRSASTARMPRSPTSRLERQALASRPIKLQGPTSRGRKGRAQGWKGLRSPTGLEGPSRHSGARSHATTRHGTK